MIGLRVMVNRVSVGMPRRTIAAVASRPQVESSVMRVVNGLGPGDLVKSAVVTVGL